MLLSDYETVLYVLAAIIVTLINVQSFFTLLLLKVRTSPTNLFHLSLTFSDLLLSVFLVLNLSTTDVPHLDTLLTLSLVSSLSASAFLSLDKMLSLAYPFYYSNIVTCSSVVKTSVLIWAFALILSLPLLFKEKISSPHIIGYFKLSIHIVLTILLVLSSTCLLYVIKVAHRHTTTIRRTAKSIHRSMHRLNSIQAHSSMSQPNTPQILRTPSVRKSPNERTTIILNSQNRSRDNVFIYPESSSKSFVPLQDFSQPPSNNSGSLILSLVFLLCGWVPFLMLSLHLHLTKQDMGKEEVWLEVIVPLVVLAAVRPHLDGKCKLEDIKKFLKKCEGRKKLEQKDMNEVIRLASVPIRLLNEEHSSNSTNSSNCSTKYARLARKDTLQNVKNTSAMFEYNDRIKLGRTDSVKLVRNDSAKRSRNDSIKYIINDPVKLVRNDSAKRIRNDTIKYVRNDPVKLVRNDSAKRMRNDSLKLVRNDSVKLLRNGSAKRIMSESTNPLKNNSAKVVRKESINVVRNDTAKNLRKNTNKPVRNESANQVTNESAKPSMNNSAKHNIIESLKTSDPSINSSPLKHFVTVPTPANKKFSLVSHSSVCA